MLTKEYRIMLPLTVDEYRIAQLYMIQKKSRVDTRGAGSGVEIIKNEPYENGPGGSGQYTYKIFHIGNHLPAWFRAILPATALQVEEEAWNAYPYTRTRYTCPFIPRFSLDVETRYYNDAGDQNNVFDLRKSELNQRIVDVMDIVKDPISFMDYLPEEDPKLYVSTKTKRGPLGTDWVDESVKNGTPLMCAYKLCKVEFRYWGMQTRIEKFIQDVALRKTMLRAHRQAWAWQDEWVDLNIEDIRNLEREAQEHLSKVMAEALRQDDEAAEGEDEDGEGQPTQVNLNQGPPQVTVSQGGVDGATTLMTEPSSNTADMGHGRGRASSVSNNSERIRLSPSTSMAGSLRSRSSSMAFARDHLESIRSDSESDTEYFDALEEQDDEAGCSGGFTAHRPNVVRWSSVEELVEKLPGDEGGADEKVEANGCRTSLLLLVFHGGSVLDSSGSSSTSQENIPNLQQSSGSTKMGDIQTFRSTLENVVRSNYSQMADRVAVRCVPCPPFCAEALTVLSSLSPYGTDVINPGAGGHGSSGSGGAGLGSFGPAAGSILSTTPPDSFVQPALIPLLGTRSHNYEEYVSTTITKANKVFDDFLLTEEGGGFNGEVFILGDALGGILAYDCLIRNGSSGSSGSGGGKTALSRNPSQMSGVSVSTDVSAIIHEDEEGGGSGGCGGVDSYGGINNSVFRSHSSTSINNNNNTTDSAVPKPPAASATSTTSTTTTSSTVSPSTSDNGGGGNQQQQFQSQQPNINYNGHLPVARLRIDTSNSTQSSNHQHPHHEESPSPSACPLQLSPNPHHHRVSSERIVGSSNSSTTTMAEADVEAMDSAKSGASRRSRIPNPKLLLSIQNSAPATASTSSSSGGDGNSDQIPSSSSSSTSVLVKTRVSPPTASSPTPAEAAAVASSVHQDDPFTASSTLNQDKGPTATANVFTFPDPSSGKKSSISGDGGGNWTKPNKYMNKDHLFVNRKTSMPIMSSAPVSPRMGIPLLSPGGSNERDRIASYGSGRSGSASPNVVRLRFRTNSLFLFGTPLGLILAQRRLIKTTTPTTTSTTTTTILSDSNQFDLLPPKPNVSGIYNLYYAQDPCCARLEPLLYTKFSRLPPINVPRFQRFPLGNGQTLHLLEYLHRKMDELILTPQQSECPAIGSTSNTPRGEIASAGGGGRPRRTSTLSNNSDTEGLVGQGLTSIQQILNTWWGCRRVDYALYCPEGLANFPQISLPNLLHASFWESPDVAAFLIRQFLEGDDPRPSHDPNNRLANHWVPPNPTEKWNRKRTSFKIKNSSANHRGNDIICAENEPQCLSARFMYGPLDVVALTGEIVDIYVRQDDHNGEWIHVGTDRTDGHGRVNFEIPTEKKASLGLHPVKMVVRGDHTYLDMFLAVVPPKTECVVFSIDGSFTASVSVSGKDPKVRAGAVDVVRHWQDLGYLILYITARPDMQQRQVISWLAQHNFPHGLLFFSDKITTDPLRQKTNHLARCVEACGMSIQAGYGSAKDVHVYANSGLTQERIFVVGKANKKVQVQRSQSFTPRIGRYHSTGPNNNNNNNNSNSGGSGPYTGGGGSYHSSSLNLNNHHSTSGSGVNDPNFHQQLSSNNSLTHFVNYSAAPGVGGVGGGGGNVSPLADPPLTPGGKNGTKKRGFSPFRLSVRSSRNKSKD